MAEYPSNKSPYASLIRIHLLRRNKTEPRPAPMNGSDVCQCSGESIYVKQALGAASCAQFESGRMLLSGRSDSNV